MNTVLTTQGVNQDITSDQNALAVGFNAKVRVTVDGYAPGSATPASYPGLTIANDHDTIRGLSINGFSTGVVIGGPSAIGNSIQGNFIGQYVEYFKPELNDPHAVVAGIGNGGDGVDIDAPTNNVLGGVFTETHNAIAGNGGVGVFIEPGGYANEVAGNLIGLLQQDASVYFQDGNLGEGLLIESSSNVIGGVATARRISSRRIACMGFISKERRLSITRSMATTSAPTQAVPSFMVRA